jgi:hypothetical protein
MTKNHDMCGEAYVACGSQSKQKSKEWHEIEKRNKKSEMSNYGGLVMILSYTI